MDRAAAADDHEASRRHEERLRAPAAWWLGAIGGAVVLSLVVASSQGGGGRLLVGLPVLMSALVAAGLGYAGRLRVVVADGVVSTRPGTFTFAVDDVQQLEVVTGDALRQERTDHALTNRVHAPPWVRTAVVLLVEQDDGRWQDYVLGTRRLDDLLRALTLNRSDRHVPAEPEVRSDRREVSPTMHMVRRHNREREARRGD